MAQETQTNTSYYQTGLTTKQWFSMSMQLRKRWWDETEMGRQPPNDALLQAIKDAEIWCQYCKKKHVGGATCMGHFP